ncbi:hypothetical protein K501DRAFT_266440 [Backusella circina FSU 941]|nr:hypothetical protein K501DRAFT_266440 [Backusella circina FSU 941]
MVANEAVYVKHHGQQQQQQQVIFAQRQRRQLDREVECNLFMSCRDSPNNFDRASRACVTSASFGSTQDLLYSYGLTLNDSHNQSHQRHNCWRPRHHCPRSRSHRRPRQKRRRRKNPHRPRSRPNPRRKPNLLLRRPHRNPTHFLYTTSIS